MNQRTKNKILFVAGTVFGLAVLGVSVGIISAQTMGQWKAPSADFPNANIYAPIDTSDAPQAKAGSLTIGTTANGVIIKPTSAANFNAVSMETNTFLKSGNNSLYVSSDGNFIFQSLDGGIRLPKLDSVPKNPTEGSIYYSNKDKTVKLRNNVGWTDIGGGTMSPWKVGLSGLYYAGDNVVISSSIERTGFFFTDMLSDVQFSDNSKVNYIKLSCDITDKIDCGDFWEAWGYDLYSYGYEDITGEHICPPSYAYNATSGKCSNAVGLTDPYSKGIYEFSNSGGAGKNDAMLETGKLKTNQLIVQGDVSAPSNVWDSPTEYGKAGDVILTIGDTFSQEPSLYSPNTPATQYSKGVSCPPGYYVIGIVVHDDDKSSSAITAIGLRCAKL